MSRYEDRTDPYFVKARRHRKEVHDHRDGICDLAADLTPCIGWEAGRCHLDVDWYAPEMRCSCSMCSLGAKEAGRKVRHDTKAAIRRGDYEAIPGTTP